MNNNDKVLKLAEEAKNLIIEFRNEASVLGENPLNDINVSEDGFAITIDSDWTGVTEFSLFEISSALHDDMECWGPASPAFYECIDMSISLIDEKYSEKNRDEFINYAGQLYYAKYRCEEIYKRLQEIDDEASKLLRECE